MSVQPTTRGWVLYDGDCSFCESLITRLLPILVRNHYAVAKLQESWVREQFTLDDNEYYRDIRLLLANDERLAGADVYLRVLREDRLLSPFGYLLSLPLFYQLTKAIYRWVANNRHRFGGTCAVK